MSMDLDDVKAITDFLTKGIYPKNFSLNDKRSLRQKSKPFICCPDTEGEVRLFHRGKNGRHQLVICDSQQKREILQAAHVDVTGQGSGRPSTTNGGIPHNGINTTRRKICERFWWRRIVEDVRSFCKECTGCCHVSATTTLSSLDNSQIAGCSESEDSEGIGAVEDSLNLPTLTPEPPPIQTVMKIDHTFSSRILESFSLLLEQQLLTDAIVASEDGLYEKPAHKVVLASASTYFKSMIVNSTQSVYYIIIPNVSGTSLEELVSYMYTGQLRLSATTVSQLCAAAESLVLPGAVELCQNFLTESEQESGNTFDDSFYNAVLVEQTFDEPARVKEEVKQVIDGSVNGRNKRTTNKKETNKRPRASLRVRETSVPDDESAPKSKRGRPAKSTGQLISLLSQNVRVESITLASRDTDDDDGNTEDAEKSSRKAQEQSHSMSMPQRRNPERTKKAGRYVNPLAKSVKCIQVKHTVSTNVPKVRSRSQNKGDSSKTCLIKSCSFQQTSGVEVERSLKPNSNSVITQLTGKLQVLRLTRTQMLKYLSIFRLFRRKALSTSSDGLSVCQLCNKASLCFASMSFYAAHCIRQHKEVWACSSCSRHFFSVGTLFLHRHLVHTRLRHLKASVKRAKSVRATDSQISRFDSQSEQLSSYNKCGWCGQKFANRSKLIDHRRSVHRRSKTESESLVAKVRRKVVRDWNCNEKGCGEQFKVKDKLREHMAVVHPSVLFSCPECRFKTQVELLLRRHLLRRHRVQHCCHLCGKSYHKPFLLRVHLFYRHKISDPSLKIHKCTHEGCSFACPSKNGLDQHLLKHTLPNSYACGICGKTFKRELGLSKHERKVHLGIRPFMCDKCGASFSDEPELKMHMTRHVENKRFSCDHCSYSTFQRSSMKSHLFTQHSVRMDTEMAVLQCSSCQFITDKRCRFNDHIKMHQNIRDIPCAHCDKFFVTRKTLRQHVNKVHRRPVAPSSSAPPVIALTGEEADVQSLTCPFCQFHSSSAEAISEHVRTIHASNVFATIGDYLGHALSSDGTSQTVDFPNGGGTVMGLQSSQVIEGQCVPVDAAMEYHILQHVPTIVSSSASIMRSVDAMSMATVNSILVGIPLQMESSQAAGYANFQPFDGAGRLVRLQ